MKFFLILYKFLSAYCVHIFFEKSAALLLGALSQIQLRTINGFVFIDRKRIGPCLNIFTIESEMSQGYVD